MNYFWKIKYGFNPTDFAVAKDFDIERVLYAIQKDTLVQVGEKFIKPANIISIEPHYHHYTGWNETYVPESGDDMKQIRRDCPDFSGRLDFHKQRTILLMKQNRVSEIGSGVELPQIELKSEGQLIHRKMGERGNGGADLNE